MGELIILNGDALTKARLFELTGMRLRLDAVTDRDDIAASNIHVVRRTSPNQTKMQDRSLMQTASSSLVRLVSAARSLTAPNRSVWPPGRFAHPDAGSTDQPCSSGSHDEPDSG